MMEEININRGWTTDEIEVRFYDCPMCSYERVPFGMGWHDVRYPQHDANFCPRCGVTIQWVERQT